MFSSKQGSTNASQRAFSEAVRALSRDMPILMHGSGDVVPDKVNPATVQLLSELTVRYIGNLVDAAADSQQLLAGNEPTVPPPPPYPRNRKPRLPPYPSEASKKDESDKKDSGPLLKNDKKDSGPLLKKRPHRPDVDYWDEPLPEPKIVKRPRASLDPAQNTNMGIVGRPSAFHSPHAHLKHNDGDTESDNNKMNMDVHIDEWVGAAGVDFWEQSRSRTAYVRMPQAIGVQCFIFPICHDGFLYGKVMQVQASRRAIAPILTNQVLMDYVRTEGALVRKHAPRRKKKESKQSDRDADVEDEPEQNDGEQEQDENAMWPGLEFLLPVHRLKALTES